MEIAALIVAIVSAVFAGSAVWYARRSSQASHRSADSSERSAAAAEEAVGYQRAEVERGRIDFTLDHSNRSAYVLTHIGTDPAYGVEVDTGDLGVQGELTSFDEFPAGHSERYLLAASMGTTTTHVVVTWHALADRSDEAKTKRLLVEL